MGSMVTVPLESEACYPVIQRGEISTDVYINVQTFLVNTVKGQHGLGAKRDSSWVGCHVHRLAPSPGSQIPGGHGGSPGPYSTFSNGEGADNHAEGKPV